MTLRSIVDCPLAAMNMNHGGLRCTHPVKPSVRWDTPKDSSQATIKESAFCAWLAGRKRCRARRGVHSALHVCTLAHGQGTRPGLVCLMLHEFLTENRQLLIVRCKEKVAKRFEPHEVKSSIEHGVPVFLEQLVETLKAEQTTSARVVESEPTPAPTAIGRAAALHGAELLRHGFTVDQVVHDYGDVCQAVTALAVEQDAAISTDEFRTLNRCLDNAIADAVASFGQARQVSLDDEAKTSQRELTNYTAEHRRLVAISLQSFRALKTGNIGIGGATGMLLEHTLTELETLTGRLLRAR